MQEQRGEVFKVPRQLGHEIFEAGQGLLWQSGATQRANVKGVPELVRLAVELFQAGFHVAVVVTRLPQVDILDVRGQVTETVQVLPGLLQLLLGDAVVHQDRHSLVRKGLFQLAGYSVDHGLYGAFLGA